MAPDDTVLGIRNLHGVATGNITEPFLEADTLVISEGRIAAIGSDPAVLTDVDIVIDATGMIVSPGLIDPHVHPMIGDWNPRQNVMGWMEAAFHGGVTSMLSQGIVHLPSMPRDAASTKAFALLSTTTYQNYRPGGGLKVQSGALVLEEGLVEQDFRELAAAGVRLVAEIGGSGLADLDAVEPMIAWARGVDMTVPMHFGAPSYPGSASLGAEEALRLQPDVLVHVNGGSTSRPLDEIQTVIEDTDAFIEIIHCGNLRAARFIVEALMDRGELDRLLLGSDTPVGHGAIPLAIIKTASQLGSTTDIEPAAVLAAATGNSARAYGLDDVGTLAVGKTADLLLIDRPTGSVAKDGLETLKVGDVPAVALIAVDGQVVAARGRNTPYTDRRVRAFRNGVGYEVEASLDSTGPLPPPHGTIAEPGVLR